MIGGRGLGVAVGDGASETAAGVADGITPGELTSGGQICSKDTSGGAEEPSPHTQPSTSPSCTCQSLAPTPEIAQELSELR